MIDYQFSPEQDELRQAVRRLLTDHAAPRRFYDEGLSIDLGLWARLVSLGAAGLGVEPADGGSGGDLIDQVVVAEELGRALAPVPFAGTVAASALLARVAGTERRRELRSRLADGRTIAAALLTGPGTGLDVPVSATARGAAWSLEGSVPVMFDAGAATLLVVPAETTGGLRLFHTEHVPPIRVLPSIDRTRPMATLSFEGQRAELIEGDDPAALLADAVARIQVILAAEAAGVAAACLEMTSSYTLARHQFGRPIGTFQAVKHRLADMLVAVENARSAAYAGAWAVAHHTQDRTLAVSMAMATATESAVTVASDAIQLHGGIGVTWEHDLHLYLRRAKTLELLFGEPSWHLDRIAAALLDRSASAASTI